MQRLLDDDELLKRIGQGDYATADPLGAYLGVYRELEITRARQHSELTIALIAVMYGSRAMFRGSLV